MARSVWTGSISFGLVNVPVRAFPAVRDHKVHFHRLEKGTGARVRNQKISDKTGDELDADDIEMGYETSKGHYVTFDPAELAELRPTSTRTIDVTDFVPLEEIDPCYYERTYWLAPDGDGARPAYALLVAATEHSQRVGIGTVVMRNTQYLTAVRPLDGALAMSTMRFADDVVPKSDLDDVPSRTGKARPKELELATAIIEALASDWKPERYHDTYTEMVRDLIERKAKGEEITVEAEAPGSSSGNVVDLMEALQASVDEAKKGRRSRRTRKATGQKTTPKKQPASKPGKAPRTSVKKSATKKSASSSTRRAS